jgi:hypothetical protein
MRTTFDDIFPSETRMTQIIDEKNQELENIGLGSPKMTKNSIGKEKKQCNETYNCKNCKLQYKLRANLVEHTLLWHGTTV